MSTTETITRVKELTAQLNEYRDEYYNKDAPSVTDEVYDRLFDELVQLEKETGVCMANSPTQTVGYPAVSALEKVQHEIPLLSLEKTKQVEELLAFQGTHRMNLSYKLDGLTTELIYENGALLRASTRGDGEIGEDITHNARAISGIPQSIPYQGRLVVVGESFIHKKDFAELQGKLLDSSGNPYKNGRNLAAGSVRSFESAACTQRRVCFLPFAVLSGLEDIERATDSKRAKLLALPEFGFGKVRCIQYTGGHKEMLETHIALLKQKAEEDDVPIDGVVLSYDEIGFSKTCGRTGHHFKDGLAFKFEDDLFESRLRYIEWTPTRSGEIAPVAVFDPVEIDGCEVSRASLHNLTFIEDLGLAPGCRLLVSKRNQIIPHVEANLDGGLFPFVCDFGKVPPEFQEHWLGHMRICADRCKRGECDGDDLHKEDPAARPCSLCVKRKARGLGLLQDTVYPATCPCCGEPTRVHQTKGAVAGKERITKTVYCDNPDCRMKRLRQFAHFVSKKAMDIEGLSEATLDVFIRCGWLETFMDIYHLDDHRAEIIRLEGFGEKSWQRLWDAIQRSRNTTFERYLIAMDIPMIGATASRQLCRHFGGSLDAFEDAVNHKFNFTQLPDFGETLHQNILNWFDVEDNRYLWEELQKIMKIQKVEAPVAGAQQDNPFVGLTIVVTGKVEPYTREGINVKIESLGAHAGSSVSKKTDYLICGENAGSKLSKARELGVKVLSPAEFFQMAGE